MADTTPQARRVMGNGGEWAARMLSTHGATCLTASSAMVKHADDDPHMWADRDASSCVWADPDEDELPDLNDPATCAVLWGQLRERCDALGSKVWLTLGPDHAYLYIIAADGSEYKKADATQADALAAAFEWVAALEVKHGQD